MTEFNVNFRGLFTVARHAPPPPKGETVKSSKEPMTILFPVDTGGLHGLTANGSAHHGRHEATLYVPEAAVGGPNGELPPLSRIEQQHERGFVGFSLRGWIVRLPMSDTQYAVSHQPDELFTVSEPRNDTSCEVVGKLADWRPLSRLANLNHLTGGTLGVDLAHPSHNVVDSIVRLSGGRLECVRSFKALRDAFFEFFTDKDTLAIQPAAEDVVFTADAPDDTLTLGLSPIVLPSAIEQISIPVSAGMTFVVSSLPPHGSPPATDLNHFFNFYKLMKDPQTKPFLRVLARCSEDRKLFYTMPGIGAINFDDYKQPIILTTEHCSCLTSQVFTTQTAL